LSNHVGEEQPPSYSAHKTSLIPDEISNSTIKVVAVDNNILACSGKPVEAGDNSTITANISDQPQDFINSTEPSKAFSDKPFEVQQLSASVVEPESVGKKQSEDLKQDMVTLPIDSFVSVNENSRYSVRNTQYSLTLEHSMKYHSWQARGYDEF
jgi:hypothetical protein